MPTCTLVRLTNANQTARTYYMGIGLRQYPVTELLPERPVDLPAWIPDRSDTLYVQVPHWASSGVPPEPPCIAFTLRAERNYKQLRISLGMRFHERLADLWMPVKVPIHIDRHRAYTLLRLPLP